MCVQNYVVLDVISNKFSTPVAQVEEKMQAALHRLKAHTNQAFGRDNVKRCVYSNYT